MKKEKSCGAIIFRMEKGTSLFLLAKFAREDDYWGLVKGHGEKNESEHETALREIYEEVGIKRLSFIPGFREMITYSPKKGVIKDVFFFLAKTRQKKTEFLCGEQVDSLWLDIDSAIEKLKYESDKSVLRKAKAFLRL